MSRGKQTSNLKHTSAADAPDAQCISLVDAAGTLDLEADTTEQLSSFLFGLQSSVRERGNARDQKVLPCGAVAVAA